MKRCFLVTIFMMKTLILAIFSDHGPCSENFRFLDYWLVGFNPSDDYQSNWIISPGLPPGKMLSLFHLWQMLVSSKNLPGAIIVLNHVIASATSFLLTHQKNLFENRLTWRLPISCLSFLFALKSTLHLSKPTGKSSICRWTFPMLPPEIQRFAPLKSDHRIPNRKPDRCSNHHGFQGWRVKPWGV